MQQGINKGAADELCEVKQGDANQAEAWLRDFATRYSYYYFGEMIRGLTEMGGSVHSSTEIQSKWDLMGDDHKLLWYNLSLYTNTVFSPDHVESIHWSCGC